MKPRYVYKWGVGPIRVKEIRQRFRDDGKRLRRARRLYARLIYEAVMQSKTEKVLWDCAQKMIDRHLYSSKTGLRDVINGLLGHLYRVAVSKGWRGRGLTRTVRGFNEWVRVNDFVAHGNKNRVRHQRNFKVAS